MILRPDPLASAVRELRRSVTENQPATLWPDESKAMLRELELTYGDCLDVGGKGQEGGPTT